MRLSCLLVIIIVIYYGCTPQTRYPKLPPDYLQSIFSEIRKIDSKAQIVNFVSDSEKFEFLDNIMQAGSFDIAGPKLKGEIRSYTETDYDVSKQSIVDSFPGKIYSITHFVYLGDKISEKHFKDSTEDKICRVKYTNDLPDQVITAYKRNNDSLKTKLIYKDGRLATTKLYSSKGILFVKEDLIYKENGNLDYQYITNKEGNDEFEKFEFNNSLHQFIVTRFDKNKNLLWLKYSEFDDKGNIVYEESFKEKDKENTFRIDKYIYNDKNEIIHNDGLWPKRQIKMVFDFKYTQRDSLDNWIERITFMDNKPYFITKRVVNYKRNKR